MNQQAVVEKDETIISITLSSIMTNLVSILIAVTDTVSKTQSEE